MPDSLQRLDRIEAALERMAEESTVFQRAVRGAITAQQDQIAEANRLIIENSRNIAELTKNVAKHDAAIANLEQQFQAYLRTIHPKQ